MADMKVEIVKRKRTLKERAEKFWKDHNDDIFHVVVAFVGAIGGAMVYKYVTEKNSGPITMHHIEPTYYDRIEDAFDGFKSLAATSEHPAMFGYGESYGVYDETKLVD